ncbi:MAG TPA: 3-methyl-2-oxobutanoate hydroxymethyltransferase [Thermodesulfobacteriota bacterium]|nr:3-methyl-2-oxobutanoate hydroxymethyltransferase [Thermodesulfobacteriota bacterium]
MKEQKKKVTIPYLMEKKRKKEQITMMAIYDYPNAIVAERTGIDIVCVSDSGGMAVFGKENTTSVTFEECMIMMQTVTRGCKTGLRMLDMPYMSFHTSPEKAIENAARFVAEGGAEVMKCEGTRHHAKNIEAIIKAGIPVMGHVGVTPMRITQLGGFVAQGKTADRAKEIVDDAIAMYEAGCFSILCEVTTSEVCEYLTETLPIPVISLGAGSKADGVHIITCDLFKLYDRHTPRHSKVYVELFPIMEKVFQDYIADVTGHIYPGPEHTIFMQKAELEKFSELVKWQKS